MAFPKHSGFLVWHLYVVASFSATAFGAAQSHSVLWPLVGWTTSGAAGGHLDLGRQTQPTQQHTPYIIHVVCCCFVLRAGSGRDTHASRPAPPHSPDSSTPPIEYMWYVVVLVVWLELQETHAFKLALGSLWLLLLGLYGSCSWVSMAFTCC